MRSRGESEGSNERTMELPLNYLIFGKQKDKDPLYQSPGYPSEVGKDHICNKNIEIDPCEIDEDLA